jgi:putative hydrolase of the HAD superfamily
MHRHGFEYLSKALDIWKYFSGIVISSHVKSIKPEQAIFEYLVITYDLIPERTLFLDDLRTNVEAARRLGFQTIQVQHTARLKETLYHKLGIRG